MRTVQDIKREMTTLWLSDAAVREKYDISPEVAADSFERVFSAVSLENLLFYTVAFCAWTLEAVFEAHKAEISRYIETMKPHTPAWYVTVAKAFQYGFDLLPDSDKFDNSGKTEDEIAESKIVKYAAVIEQENRLQIKVARFDGSDLAELAPEELAAFAEYINRVRDAGVPVNVLTGAVDALKIELRIFYNPLILNFEGKRIDGTNDFPVKNAIKNYLANIEFDGTFVIAKMIDAVQAVDGVEIPVPLAVQYRFPNGTLWQPVTDRYRPSNGYARIADEDLVINYVAN